ncbi:hypothetical protein ONZ45_g6765 [Pleurotus djamor]|nr:hypothetical protein ONZ45_g6765 [Pleurotus djamor]
MSPPGLATLPSASKPPPSVAGTSTSRRSSSSISGSLAPKSDVTSDRAASSSTSTASSSATSWNVQVLDHITMTIGPGFVVEKLTTGFETPFVLMDGIPSNVSTTLLTTRLSEYARVLDVRVIGGKKHRIRFGNANEAQDIIRQLNGRALFDHKISAKLVFSNGDRQRSGANGVLKDTCVWMTWEVPGKVAYGGYASKALSNRAIARAISQGYHAELYEGLPAVSFFTVKFFGIPATADKEWLSRFGPLDDAMWEEPRYTDIDSAIRAVKSRLDMSGDVIDFEVLPGQNAGMVRAIASFLSPNQAKLACERLHGWKPVSIGKTRIAAFHRQELKYVIPGTAFAKIEADINLLARTIHERYGMRVKLSIIHIGPPSAHGDNSVKIRLSADELKDLVQSKNEFEKILRGEVVRENGRLIWDGFFSSSAGSAFIRDLELTYRGICIEVDIVRRTLVLWGAAAKREPVRDKILDKASELRTTQVFSIPVPRVQLPGLCSSPDMHKLQDELGSENLWLELSTGRVMRASMRYHCLFAFPVVTLGVKTAYRITSLQR